MLSVKFPQIHELILSDFHGGLMPIRFTENSDIVLIVKATKEMILTAKINKGFHLYVPKLKINSIETTSFISVFPDDEYDPLTIRTPLFDEPLTKIYQELFQQEHVDVYFFTETNIELLGYSSTIQCAKETRLFIKNTSFLSSSTKNSIDLLEELVSWFNARTTFDESDTISINFKQPLFPDNLTILDASSLEQKHATDTGMYITKLERQEPGSYQETEISHFFSHLFNSSKIFLNPTKKEDGEEISDLIVFGKKFIIFVQAKDSPNTEKTIYNTIKRKKSTTLKHLKKAQRQISGAIKYAMQSSTLEFFIRNPISKTKEEFSIKIDGLEVIGLIVIKELFHDDYDKYTSSTMKLCNEINFPCIVLDFFELHKYCMSLEDENAFLNLFNFVYNTGKESGEFPRIQFMPSDKDDQSTDGLVIIKKEAK